MTDFKNARGRIIREYKTISGADVKPEWDIWFELYCFTFIEKLESLGFTDDVTFESLLTYMDQFKDVGDFHTGYDEPEEIIELAAYGLIVFDRLHGVNTNMSCIDVFNLSHQLGECFRFSETEFTLETARLKYKADHSDRAKKGHAESPKQKAKAEVRDYWKKWQKNPLDSLGKERYKNPSEFALSMLRIFDNLGSQAVIVGWCRIWKAEEKTSV